MKISDRMTVRDRAGRVCMSDSHKSLRSTRMRVMTLSMIGIHFERVY